jgi:hypothetical protein
MIWKSGLVTEAEASVEHLLGSFPSYLSWAFMARKQRVPTVSRVSFTSTVLLACCLLSSLKLSWLFWMSPSSACGLIIGNYSNVALGTLQCTAYRAYSDLLFRQYCWLFVSRVLEFGRQWRPRPFSLLNWTNHFTELGFSHHPAWYIALLPGLEPTPPAHSKTTFPSTNLKIYRLGLDLGPRSALESHLL